MISWGGEEEENITETGSKTICRVEFKQQQKNNHDINGEQILEAKGETHLSTYTIVRQQGKGNTCAVVSKEAINKNCPVL